MAGPAYCAAAWPVSTKMPAPISAPMPSEVTLNSDSERRRLVEVPAASLCSPSALLLQEIDRLSAPRCPP